MKKDHIEDSNRIAEEVQRYGLSFRIMEEYAPMFDAFTVRVDVFVGGEQYIVNFLRSTKNELVFKPFEVVSMLRKFARVITKTEKKKAAK